MAGSRAPWSFEALELIGYEAVQEQVKFSGTAAVPSRATLIALGYRRQLRQHRQRARITCAWAELGFTVEAIDFDF